jgi:hypothetical protein
MSQVQRDPDASSVSVKDTHGATKMFRAQGSEKLPTTA